MLSKSPSGIRAYTISTLGVSMCSDLKTRKQTIHCGHGKDEERSHSVIVEKEKIVYNGNYPEHKNTVPG